MLPFIRSDLAQLNTYQADPEGSEMKQLTQPIDRLDTNECPYDLPMHLKQKLTALYRDTLEANRYPNGDHGVIKAAIASYVNESGVNESEVNESGSATQMLDATWISMGNGSDELIRSAIMATCLGGEGAILVAQPTFSMYGILAQTLGVPVVTIDRTESFGMDLEAAQTAITQAQSPPIRVVFVVHPNSPTANPLTPTEIQWLERLPENILVVVDEAYFEFSQTTLVNHVLQHPNWMILRTFSKAFRLAAHRVGYAIAQPTMIATLEKMRLPYNLTAVSLAAAELAMSHRSELLAMISPLVAERDQLLDKLKTLPQLQCWPTVANFIYVQARSLEQSQALYQALKAQGTSIRFTGGGLRITVGTPEENQRTWSRVATLCSSLQW